MNTNLIPSPDTIPVHHLWFQVLLLLTFLLHIILMNFVLGGSLITLWDNLRGKTGGKDSYNIPTMIALAVNFGVPPLLFVQVLYGHFFYSSSVIMAVPWILVIPVLILAYYGAYVFVVKGMGNSLTGRISLMVSSFFLLLLAFIYVNNNLLALTPERWEMYFERPSGWNMNTGQPTLIPRFLHFVIGAVAVAGLGKSVFYFFSRKYEASIREAETARGIRIFAFATMIQVIIGIWFWLALPKDIMMLFMGRNLVYTGLMLAGILISLGMIYTGIKKMLLPTMMTTLVLLVVMVVVRDLVRKAYLGEVFRPSDLLVTPQAGPLVAFLLIFLAGLGFIFYMIRIAFPSKTAEQ